MEPKLTILTTSFWNQTQYRVWIIYFAISLATKLDQQPINLASTCAYVLMCTACRVYVGSTSQTFKQRLYKHTASFKKEDPNNTTTLSRYINNLQKNNAEYKIKWNIIRQSNQSKRSTRFCTLCNLEKMAIALAEKKTLLNSRNELISKCVHNVSLFFTSVAKRKRSNFLAHVWLYCRPPQSVKAIICVSICFTLPPVLNKEAFISNRRWWQYVAVFSFCFFVYVESWQWMRQELGFRVRIYCYLVLFAVSVFFFCLNSNCYFLFFLQHFLWTFTVWWSVAVLLP